MTESTIGLKEMAINAGVRISPSQNFYSRNSGNTCNKRLIKLYRGRGTRQVNRPAEQPWFDQPNVMKLLEQRRRGAEKFAYKEFEDLQHWHHYWDT